jgi:ATP-dependent RNA helicase RhlE
MPFQALGLGPKLTRAIRDAGYTEPTPIQSAAIPAILEGSDIIGVAQTGTGKTAAFVLPILERLAASPPQRNRKIRALIVSPTRELAVQIDENIRRYARYVDLKFAIVYGGVGERPQLSALRNGVDVVVATPGRLNDLAGRGGVDFSALQYLVLDEGDRMLDMGFLPQIRQIVRPLPKKRQTMLFSATFSKEIETVADEFLTHPKKVQIGRSHNPAETVAQHVFEVGRDGKVELLLHLLRDEKLDMVLVFSRTRHGADKIARRLLQSGIMTATLHSSRSQGQRLAALRGFKAGTYRVLVATDIAARGIDVDGISHVINFDFPPQPEDYVHRIGRTGRAHAIGDALSFATPDDRVNLRALERFLGRGIPRREVPGLTIDLASAPASAPRPAASSQRPRSPYHQAGRPQARGQEQRPHQRGTGSQSRRPGGSPGRPAGPSRGTSSKPKGERRFR